MLQFVKNVLYKLQVKHLSRSLGKGPWQTETDIPTYTDEQQRDLFVDKKRDSRPFRRTSPVFLGWDTEPRKHTKF